MSRVLTVLLWIVGIIAVLGVIAFAWIYAGVGKGRALRIGEADLATLSDGTYQGAYDSGRFTTRVEVTVADHRIADIKIVKDVSFVIEGVGQKIIDSVLAKQSLAVDTVSGATVNSKAYLRAIENALKSTR